ncbi:MAG: ABC transporter ATP-binding protein [Rhodospirillales bacterium]
MARSGGAADAVPQGRGDGAGAAIAVSNLTKRFHATTAVDRVTLAIESGEFLALLGPSGSGKTTILMSIAGFEFPSDGRILIDGKDCTRLPPNKRDIGMVFQNYTLFPHLSVVDNVAFPLKMRGVGKAARRRQAEAALAVVRLSDFGGRMPNQLSGGQQQRVALARATVYQPRVLLMDEPLSALDKNLRDEMQLEIKRLHAQLGVTVVFVTHDQGEALKMADRIAVLKDGRLQQIAPARELYERPANLFTASFVGEMNLLPATAQPGAALLESGQRWQLPDAARRGDLGEGAAATLGFRPERVILASAESLNRLEARIEDLVYAGAETLIIARLPSGGEVRARIPSVSDGGLRPGAEVTLACPPEALLLYPAEVPG